MSTEVLEHLKDLPDRYQELFTGSGLDAALREAYCVLRSGGLSFATTPTGASIYNPQLAVSGRPAWSCGPHVREYTLAELSTHVRDAGFAIISSRMVHCMTVDHRIDCSTLYSFPIEQDYGATDRGDDIFLTARKPRRPQEVAV